MNERVDESNNERMNERKREWKQQWENEWKKELIKYKDGGLLLESKTSLKNFFVLLYWFCLMSKKERKKERKKE